MGEVTGYEYSYIVLVILHLLMKLVDKLLIIPGECELLITGNSYIVVNTNWSR